jgi:predicted nucleic acid-binding protein
MTRGRAVVDASVVVHLLIDAAAPAQRLAERLASMTLHAPDHVGVEVANALRRLRNQRLLAESEAALALHGFGGLPIQLWPFEALSARAWQLGHNVSSYDAAYVALAERLDAPLFTADRRLARASGPSCTFEVFGDDHR